MNIKNRLYEFIYYFIIGTLLTISISISMVAGTIIVIDIIDIILYSLLFMFSFYLLFFNRYSIIIFISLLSIASIVAFFLFREGGPKQEWFDTFSYKAFELIDFVMGYNTYTDKYDRFLAIAIVALVAIIVASTLRTKIGFFVITALGAVSIAIPAFYDWEISQLAVLIFIFCFIIMLLEKLNSFSLPDKPANSTSINASYVIMFIPLGLAALLISAFIVKPNVDDVNIVQSIRNSSLFFDESSVDISSFSENQQSLGGAIQLNDTFVMEVTSSSPIRVTGHVYDIYNGTGWTKVPDNGESLSANSDGNFQYAFYQSNLLRNQNKYAKRFGVKDHTIVINVYGNRTKYIFTPPFANTIKFDDGNSVNIKTNGEVRSKHLIPYDGTYTQTYTDWNYSSNNFMDHLMNMSNDAVYDPFINDTYLQLPTNLPTRVTALAKEITASYNSNYEKLKAIETYLRQFPYTLEPNPIPNGRDFVDYFVFEGKEGYCVYYATAMVVMARSIGIPTRYVEGFVMPPYRNINGNFSVTNEQAHAWAEAYFPEFGWVGFEPTAGYSSATGFGGEYGDLGAIVPDINQLPPVSLPENPVDESVTDPIIDEELNEDPVTDNTEIDAEGEITDPMAIVKEELPVGTIVIFIVLSVLTLIIIAFVLRYQKHKTKLEAIKTFESKEQVVDYFSNILSITEAMGYKRAVGETVIEYANRVKEDVGMEELVKLSEIFSQAYYSDNDVNAAQADYLRTSYNWLYKEHKANVNYFKFTANKYLLLKY